MFAFTDAQIVSLAIAVVAAGPGYLAYKAARRRNPADAGAVLVSMGLQIAQRADSERQHLADRITQLETTVAEQAEEIRQCRGDRELLLAIATKAGLDVKDMKP